MRTMQNFQLLTNCDDLKLKLVLTKNRSFQFDFYSNKSQQQSLHGAFHYKVKTLQYIILSRCHSLVWKSESREGRKLVHSHSVSVFLGMCFFKTETLWQPHVIRLSDITAQDTPVASTSTKKALWTVTASLHVKLRLNLQMKILPRNIRHF